MKSPTREKGGRGQSADQRTLGWRGLSDLLVVGSVALLPVVPLAVGPNPAGAREAAPATETDLDAIKRVLEEAYLKGIHEEGDEGIVRSGFHEEFRMYVLQDGRVVPVGIEEWMTRLGELREADPDLWARATRISFDEIDVTGDCAVVKLTVHKGTRFFSKDRMLLYRLPEGWRIVAKVFTTRQPEQ